jgi:hypothetical protein
MPLVLYTMAEATTYFNDETRLSLREETLRHRLKKAHLTIHKVGNLDLVAKDDLSRLIKMPEPRKGRPPKSLK